MCVYQRVNIDVGMLCANFAYICLPWEERSCMSVRIGYLRLAWHFGISEDTTAITELAWNFPCEFLSLEKSQDFQMILTSFSHGLRAITASMLAGWAWKSRTVPGLTATSPRLLRIWMSLGRVGNLCSFGKRTWVPWVCCLPFNILGVGFNCMLCVCVWL